MDKPYFIRVIQFMCLSTNEICYQNPDKSKYKSIYQTMLYVYEMMKSIHLVRVKKMIKNFNEIINWKQTRHQNFVVIYGRISKDIC